MNKAGKIILVSVLLTFFVLCLGEAGARYVKYRAEHPDTVDIVEFETTNGEKIFDYSDGKEDFSFREPVIKDETGANGAIVLGGCSFAYGDLLPYDDTPGVIFSEQTGKNVYNWGVNGGTAREFLYLLRSDEAVNKLTETGTKDSVKEVFYVYIPDQKARLFCDLWRKSPHFTYKKDKGLVYDEHNSPLQKSVLYYHFSKFYAYHLVNNKDSFDRFCEYMKEIQKEVKRVFGDDTKFSVIVFRNDSYNDDWSKLEKEGIPVFVTDDMTDKDLNSEEYTGPDGYHPNRKAWETVIPLIYEKMNK